MTPEPDLLASDAERERVAEALREHAAAGRLDPEELDQRLGLAFAARTRGDLAPLTADLPAAPTPPTPRPRRPRTIPPVVPIAILLVAIWALTGADYFWPVWPIGAMALGSFKHSRSSCRPQRRAHPVS